MVARTTRSAGNEICRKVVRGGGVRVGAMFALDLSRKGGMDESWDWFDVGRTIAGE
jgi:hypothetical protein